MVTERRGREYITYVPIITAEAVGPGDPGEDDLVADNSPSSASVRRLRELVIKPILLVRTHQSSRCVIPDEIDVVVIPAYTTISIARGLKHNILHIPKVVILRS